MWGWVGGAGGDLTPVSAPEMGILAAGAGSIVLFVGCGAQVQGHGFMPYVITDIF